MYLHPSMQLAVCPAGSSTKSPICRRLRGFPYKTADECAVIRRELDDASTREGRDPLPLSLMAGCFVGEDRAELLDRAGRLAAWRRVPGGAEGLLETLDDSWIVGTLDEATERLRGLAAAGVERVMLQHLLHRDLDAIRQIGRQVAPAVA